MQRIPKQPIQSVRRPTQAYHTHREEKNKGIIVDQDGFQQVGNKKWTQKNIFMEEELKKNAF